MTAQTHPTMSAFEIRHAVGDPDRLLWDRYVRSHAHASLYHLFGWGNVIREAYGHSTHYLMDLARGSLKAPSLRGFRHSRLLRIGSAGQ
jgi:hypothetical protein